MPPELVGSVGVNALKRHIREMYPDPDTIQLADASRQLEAMGWYVVACPSVHTGKKSRIVFKQGEFHRR